MVIYGITLVPLVEDIWVADLGLITQLYTDDVAFDGLVWRSTQVFKLLMERGLDRGYFTKLFKYLFIVETSGKDEAARREFAVKGLDILFLGGSRYLGSYLGAWEELEGGVKYQVEAWYHRVKVISKIANRHP